MAKRQPYQGVYANIEFPPYEYVEFPKHVKTGKGTFETVNSTEEEAALRKRLQLKADVLQAEDDNTPGVPDPARETLFARAKELNVPINRKWSTTKLQAVIGEAEKSVDDLPAEENIASPVPKKNTLLEITATGHDENGSGDDEDDKDALIEQAKALGIPATRTWGVPRIKHAIAQLKE